jgi:carbamoyltransferase
MIRWGITANSHDAAIAVFVNDEIKFAAHSERSSGVKNDKHLNAKMISQALEYGFPNEIHWYETQWLKRLRQLTSGQYKLAFFKEDPQTTLEKLGIGTYTYYDLTLEDLPPRGYFMNPWGEIKNRAKFYYHRHHASHAAAGYFTSPFRDAAILVIDSIGEFETLTIWHGKDAKMRKLFSQSYPHSVGLWYSAMTQRIGLKPNEEEYILMGWAAVGDPEKYKQKIFDDFFKPFDGTPNIHFKQNLHRGCLWWAPELNTVQDYADIAAGTQAVYEMVFDYLVMKTKEIVGDENIVIMGGCALNCVANGLAYKYFDNVWIMPNPGDAGSAVGCVLDHTRKHVEFTTPYLGYNIDGPYPVNAALHELGTVGMVGVANGPAEYGPRALGNRSLLADPRGQEMKDLVNTVKRRQEFRPFAPVIMAEHVHDYFDMPAGCDHSPYMQFIGTCKRPDLYPAITHLDGTSRVQTVTREQHPGLYELLERWYAQTGCPMLLNTSLNIKGEPMVDDEDDAERWTRKYNVKVLTRDDT